MKETLSSEKEIKSSQKLLFRVLLVLMPVLILLLFEASLRLFKVGEDLSLFIENPTEGFEQYYIVNPVNGKKYFQKLEYTNPANDIFLKKKDDECFRIFVLGSSTVFGFPYEYNLMFSRILHKRLEDAYPDKKIEMINTAITAINSFTLLDYSRQISKYDPDAVLIYAGHNEFYGAFGLGSNEAMNKRRSLTFLHIRLMDLRIYQLIRNLIGSTMENIASSKSDPVHGTLMKRIVANEEISLHGEVYELTMENYQKNMEDILKIFDSKNVPVFFSELISNIKDLEPFNSCAADNQDAAEDIYNKALLFLDESNIDEAKKLFYHAKDLDCIRFRASEEVNDIIRELAEKHLAYLVSMLNYFMSESPGGLIGNNLLTEHVHPNIEGNFLMAEAFFNEIIKSEIIGKTDKNKLYSSGYYHKNWGYTALDSLKAIHNIAQLKGFWPFVKNESESFDYRFIYKPKSMIDQVAFTAFRDKDKQLYELRLQLAKEYEKKKDFVSAYREYEALVRTNPYLPENYRDAASILLQLGELPLALKYFEKSLKYEASFFAEYRMGEILIIKGDFESAIVSFENAFHLAPDDETKLKIMGLLYKANIYANNKKKASDLANELSKYNAARYLKIPQKTYSYRSYIPYKTKTHIIKANQLFREGNAPEALSLLEASLKIYDSHIAHLRIGEIYLHEENFQKAYEHFDYVFDEFRYQPGFLYDFADIQKKLGKKEEAEKTINELNKIDADFIMKKQIMETFGKASSNP